MQWVLLCRNQPGVTTADRAAAILTLISNTTISTADFTAAGRFAGWSSSWFKAEGALLGAAAAGMLSTQQGAGLQMVRSAVAVMAQRAGKDRQAQQLLSKMRVSDLHLWVATL
jgi:hypothetical protein